MRKTLNDFAATGAQTLLSEAALHSQHVARRDRCGARLGLTDAAIETMVRSFLASDGSATKCPAAYAIPSRQCVSTGVRAMTDDELIDAYHVARCGYESAKAEGHGNRVDAFVQGPIAFRHAICYIV